MKNRKLTSENLADFLNFMKEVEIEYSTALSMMKKCENLVIDEDFRMKVVNFLKIYGYYNGILSNLDIQKKYINGEEKVEDIIKNKSDFKELKRSVSKVLDYSYENRFGAIENVMNTFYNEECKNIRNLYGNFFDRH